MVSYLDSSVTQIITSSLVFTGGALLSFPLAKAFCCNPVRSLCIYIWHSLFCFIYMAYVLNYGGDATMYFKGGVSGEVDFYFGTDFVKTLVYLLAGGLGLSFVGVSLVFQYMGFVGLLAFDSSLRAVTWGKPKTWRVLATLFVFFPSVSFWSAGLGKDAISFLGVSLALWGALNQSNRWTIIAGIIVMLSVRPHMAAIMGFAYAVSFVLQRKIPVQKRLVLGVMAVVVSALLMPIGLEYAGLGPDPKAEQVVQYIEERQAHNMHGGGAVDISSMGVLGQLYTYMFRPTILEVNGIFSLAAAVENGVVFFLFVAWAVALVRLRKPEPRQNVNRAFMWCYSLVSWILLAATSANLGIALRQKWMFLPMLIVLSLMFLGRYRAKRFEAYSTRRFVQNDL